MGKRIRLPWRFGGIALAVAVLSAANALADTAAREQALKAAFVYNFAKFTNWPEGSFAGPASAMEFCFDRGSLERPALETLRGKLVRDRPVNVKVLHGLQNINACHVMYLGGDAPASIVEAILPQAAGAGVLVVSDAPGFARQGGHIGLVRSGNRLRFEINIAAAARAGLTFSSKLLQLAIIIDGNE